MLGESLRKARAQVVEAISPPARLISDEDRRAAVAEIYDAGRLTPTYGFMLFSACGIAALGLLQSSVAVIIGAMLISPLMGPIMAMGMALAQLRPREFRRAALTLAMGALLSVLASMLIVWVSPLKDATPEILARTRPTLLDLIIALLSGFVGAYLTINRKGGAIAGVAIAVALMPPLAVVGYGIATGVWAIAGGALLLFMTNVVAILAAVFGVARRYGFRPVGRHGAAWEVPVLLAVTVALCVPLAISLRSIVIEARETTLVRAAVNQAFAGGSPHITELTVETGRAGASAVEGVVVTRKYFPNAERDIAAQLNPGATVEVEQIISATGAPPIASSSVLGARPASAPAAPSPEQQLRAMLSAVGQVQGVRRSDAALEASLVMPPPAGLADYLAVEQAAQRFLPGMRIRIVPPPMRPAPIAFARGSSALSEAARRELDAIAWGLGRWGATAARIEGRASPGPRGPRPADERMALARADAVALALRDRGIGDLMVTTSVPDALDGDEARWLTAQITPAPRRRP